MTINVPFEDYDIRAILLDLGNVLIDVDFHRCARIWSARAGIPAATLVARFRIDDAYRAFECGTLSAPAYFAALRRQLGINLPDDDLREGWNAIIGEEKPGIRERLACLRRRYPLFVMTNTNPLHEAVWADTHRTLLALFEDVFVSSRMGCRKPDAHAYHRAAQTMGQPCSRILFFDDSEENIAGARKCGMPAIQVDSAETIVHWMDTIKRPSRIYNGHG